VSLPPVYSLLIFAEAGVDGLRVLSPPDGFRWIIRDIDVYASVTFASREVHIIGSHNQTFFWFDWGPGDQSSQHWTGRHCIDPPGQLRIQTSDLVDVSISGYQLALP
jgi:hypothetical protein